MTTMVRRMFGKRQLIVFAMIAFFGIALLAVPRVGAQATPDTTTGCVTAGQATSRNPLQRLRQERRENRSNCDRVVLNQVSELTGLENSAIVTGLKDGQSLAEISEAAGVSRTDLIDGITSAVSDKIDERVASGDVAAEQKAIWMDKLAANIDSIIDWHLGDRRDAAPSMSTPNA